MKRISFRYMVLGWVLMLWGAALLPEVAWPAQRVLLVGVDNYANLPTILPDGTTAYNLKGPPNDIQKMKEILLRYDFSAGDILSLQGPEATRSAVVEAFSRWLIQGTKPGDTAVFYFSGHGIRVPDLDGDELDDGLDEGFVLYDFDPITLKGILLDDDFARLIGRLEGRHVVVIADSCHSGGALRSIGSNVVSSLEPTWTSRARYIPLSRPTSAPAGVRGIGGTLSTMDIPNHVVYWAASREDQVAIESFFGDRMYGLFTYYLAKILENGHGLTYKRLHNDLGQKIMNTRAAQAPVLIANEKLKGLPVFNRTAVSASPTAPPETAVAAAPAKPKPPVSASPTTPPETAVAAAPAKPKPPVSASPTTPPETAVAAAPAKPKPTSSTAIAITSSPIKVFVAVDAISGASSQDMAMLRDLFGRFPSVRLVSKGQFADLVLRGEKRQGIWRLRFVNTIGDVQSFNADTPEALAEAFRQRVVYVHNTKLLSQLEKHSPPFRLEAWVTERDRRDFYEGEQIVFHVRSDQDASILILNVDRDGTVYTIFPNKFGQDNRIRAGQTLTIPDNTGVEASNMVFREPLGEEMVKVIAVASPQPFDFASLELLEDFEQGATGTTRGIAGVVKLNPQAIQRLMPHPWSEVTFYLRSHKRR